MTTCNGDGLVQENPLRDIFKGDGRIWTARFASDITGMVGTLAIKRKVTDSDDDALVPLIQGVLGAPDGEGKIYTLVFTLSDADSATLPLGAVHIGVRVKPLGGVTVTVVNEMVRVLVASPDVVGV